MRVRIPCSRLSRRTINDIIRMGTINMADEKKSREVGELSVKVSADVGEAITGFKALQRELRETTRAARELEQAYKDAETAVNKNACADCGGSGFVSIGEGIRGVKKCDASQ